MRVKSEHKPVLVVSSVQTDESDVPIDTLQKSEKSVAFCNDGDVGYAPFIQRAMYPCLEVLIKFLLGFFEILVHLNHSF